MYLLTKYYMVKYYMSREDREACELNFALPGR